MSFHKVNVYQANKLGLKMAGLRFAVLTCHFQPVIWALYAYSRTEARMAKSTVITIAEEFSKLNFFSGRTPETTDEESKDAFAMLSEYSNGGVYIGHYNGYSEWERHSQGDELVQVLSGKTTLVLLVDGQEHRNELSKGQLLVVPQGI